MKRRDVMKKLNRVVLTAAAMTLALGLTLTSMSEAQQGRRAQRAQTPDAPAMAQRGPAALDLSDAQKDQLAAMRLENRKEAMLRRGEMASLQAQLQAEFLNDEVNESKVRSLSKQISDLRAGGAEARLEHRLAMLKLLTPEQKEKIKEMRLNAPGRGMRGGPGFHEGRGGRGGRGGPGFHEGRGGRGGRGGPGFGGGPGRGAADCPFGAGGGPGGFLGDADPDASFGPWWLDPGADLEDGPEAPPAPEGDDATN
jgi:Spy/CpxP family protein refolding chaperone